MHNSEYQIVSTLQSHCCIIQPDWWWKCQFDSALPGLSSYLCPIRCLLKALCLLRFATLGSGASVSMWTGFSSAGVKKTSAVTSFSKSCFASVLFVFCISFTICFSRTRAAAASLISRRCWRSEKKEKNTWFDLCCCMGRGQSHPLLCI